MSQKKSIVNLVSEAHFSFTLSFRQATIIYILPQNVDLNFLPLFSISLEVDYHNHCDPDN